jgi:tripartite-type tricarboxylate transporter receptor subunit TctC
MLKTKRLTVIVLIIALIMGLPAGLVGASHAAEWKFTRPIEIMIPAAAGGGLDSTLRPFAPLLEKELGVSIVIDNRTGGSGVIGYTYGFTQPRDGYNFQFTAPSFIGPASQGQFSVPVWDELIPILNLVQAEAMLFAGKNAPFKTLEEMVAYAKANPGKVSVTVDTPPGISGACLKVFTDALGLKFNIVTSTEDESIISVIAGDIDMCLNTWTDCGAYVDSKDLIAICTLTEEQSTIVPDVPSTATVGAPVSLGYYRAFTALKGTPQEAIDAFTAGVMRAANTEEWKAFLASNGLNNEYLWDAAELREVLDKTYELFGELFK